jgi:hypothetical protein
MGLGTSDGDKVVQRLLRLVFAVHHLSGHLDLGGLSMGNEDRGREPNSDNMPLEVSP